MVNLGTLGGTNAFASGISADGSVVVGWASNSDRASRAFRGRHGRSGHPGRGVFVGQRRLRRRLGGCGQGLHRWQCGLSRLPVDAGNRHAVGRRLAARRRFNGADRRCRGRQRHQQRWQRRGGLPRQRPCFHRPRRPCRQRPRHPRRRPDQPRRRLNRWQHDAFRRRHGAQRCPQPCPDAWSREGKPFGWPATGAATITVRVPATWAWQKSASVTIWGRCS